MDAAFRACIVFCLIVLSGCADILPWPGFEGGVGPLSYPGQIPANAVVQQVKCELSQFVDEDTNPANASKQLLDPTKGAQVQLKLTTDLQGYVNYTGVNLSGLGLGALANLVTKTNNVPSLQLKAQGKSTVTSQLDFVIPQTDSSPQLLLVGNPARPTSTPIPRHLLLPKYNDCRPRDVVRGLHSAWFQLWLKDALERYAGRIYNANNWAPDQKASFYEQVCSPKLTISTQFQLLFDVNAGANVLAGAPIILPISGLTVDASPDYTHYLQIAFALKAQASHKICDALQSQNTPPH